MNNPTETDNGWDPNDRFKPFGYYEKCFINIKLLVSVNNNDISRVNTLLLDGANINYRDSHGKSVLMIAAKKNYYQIVQMLLERGANTEFLNHKGRTALFLAVKNGQDESAKILIRWGANINVVDYYDMSIRDWVSDCIICCRYTGYNDEGNRKLSDEIQKYIIPDLGNIILSYLKCEECDNISKNMNFNKLIKNLCEIRNANKN